MKSNYSYDKLSVKFAEKWFEQLPASSSKKETPPEDVVMALNAEASNVLDSETKLYTQIKEAKRDKDFLWVKRILHSGTLSDKISAYTLLIQEAPVYNLNNVDTLISMINTKGKRECLMAMDALQDLFLNNLLAEDRKLKQFKQQPLGELDTLCKKSPVLRKRYLVLWLFEDKLKALYKRFLENVNSVSYDTIEKTKQKAVNVLFNLLKDNPEQEQFLLEHLVNKIGDPVPKVGSHVCHLLGQLLVQHPDMKGIVVQEVERLVFRPNLPERAKYYSLCFLNQIILSHDEFELANHLIMVYFGKFKLFVKKGEVNTKMMSALLTGVARAYPFAKLKENVIMEQLDAMYRLVHVVSFNISIQALMLIFQVLDSKDSVSDRFYCALYRKLFDPALSKSSRQASLLNLVYRALKKDVATVRVKAFVKRLLQVSLYQSQNLQCGILVMLSEVRKIHPGIFEVKQRFDSDSDSEEHYEDILDEESEQERPKKDAKDSPKKAGPSWVHRPNSKHSHKTCYDYHSRNPLHSGAEFSNIWELLFLKHSFHPSVSLFAHQLLSAKEIKYSGDPLLDFTTARFLDRFVYRNPKRASETFEQDVHTRVFGPRKLKASSSSKLPPISSIEYTQQKPQNVPAEEQFIYRYLQQKTVSQQGKKKDDSDVESVCSEDFQKLLDDIHPEDEGKDSLNFAKELGMKNQKRKAKTYSEDEDSAESLGEDSEDVDFDDDEFEAEFGDIKEELNNVDDELCEEDFVGFGEDVDAKPLHKKRKVQRLSDTNLLASADEFSALLEENAGGKVDTITAGAFVNKDKSGAKQIAWEMDRDRKIKGNHWLKKKKKKFFKQKQ